MRRRFIVIVSAVGVISAVTLAGCDNSIKIPAPSSTFAGPSSGVSAPFLPTGPTGPLAPSVSAPLAGRDSAELHVVGGFTTISVTTGAIGNDLFRASVALGSGGLPVATVTGNVVTIAERDAPSSNGGGGSKAIQVVLSPGPAWRVAFDGGASIVLLDLSGARVSGVDLTQGVSSLEMTLPAPTATTPVSIAAGASQVRVHLRGSAPVRATMSAGAGQVTLDGVGHSGIGAGTMFATAGWDTAVARIDINCSAGVSSLIVDRV
jgi:hypothetical protein